MYDPDELVKTRDEVRKLFLDANFIFVKRVEFVDQRSERSDVSFTIQVDNYGTSPEPTLAKAMRHILNLHKEQSNV